MKKYYALLAAAAILAGSAVSVSAQAPAADDEPITIVATIFPEYDWVREILGERPELADVTLLLDSGVDLHSYQPTANDMITIADCDLFIYVGGESDGWVDDALAEAANPEMKVVNLLEVLGDGAKEEELAEGMEHDHEHEHDEEHEEHEDHDDHDGELDEHVWLSLRNAPLFVGVIAQSMAELDEENGAFYLANAEDYKGRIAALDAEYEAVIGEADFDTLLFADRFPFRYLTDDYGLSYYAAFSGCSAETEASFETIVFLAGKTDELGLPAILTIEGSDGRIAETVRGATREQNQQILTLNSMQSVTAKDAGSGSTYLSIMAENLEVIREALSA